MAETKFLLSDSDTLLIAELVISEGGLLVPDCDYKESIYVVLSTLEQFKEYRKLTNQFFILHESWDSEPLEMKSFSSRDGDVNYFIVQKCGGPTIDYFSTGEYLEGERKRIGKGFLSYYPQYWSPKNQCYIKVPSELKYFYNRLVKTLKQDSTTIKIEQRRYWIKNHSLKGLDN